MPRLFQVVTDRKLARESGLSRRYDNFSSRIEKLSSLSHTRYQYSQPFPEHYVGVNPEIPPCYPININPVVIDFIEFASNPRMRSQKSYTNSRNLSSELCQNY